MNKRRFFLFGGLAVLYCLLLVLLVAAESASPDASIVSVPAALWYSLTTLTTVGYGDMYPVTAAGRVIGTVFQLASLGLLALLIGAFVSALRGALLPLLRLRFKRRKTWYVLSEVNEASLALAGSLRSEDPDGVVLFAGTSDAAAPMYTAVARTPAQIVAYHKDKAPTHVFCIGSDASENERLASSLRDVCPHVYCLTAHEPDHLSENVIPFNPYECTARLYWHLWPVTGPTETIVIAGSGRYAEALLEQALLQNVVDDPQQIVYHIFGDFADFRRNHPRLSEISGDRLLFSDAPWNADPSILASADRLIFCNDDENSTVRDLTALLRYFPVTGKVHARLSGSFEGAETFGAPEEIYSAELVMKHRLSQTAIRLNDLYRASAPNAPAWNELSWFIRRSNLASADHLETKIRILLPDIRTEQARGITLSPELCRRAYQAFTMAPESERERFRRIEHERWQRFHYLNNWSYAPVRDNALRHHPLLVPFEELSAADQIKDDYAWELLKEFIQI